MTPLVFVDGRSFEINEDVALLESRDNPLVLVLFVDGKLGKLVFVSKDECPSNEPLVSSGVGGFNVRSVSDIV